MDTKEITSTANATVKETARLRRKRRRYESRHFLAEGEDLLMAALAGGYMPRQVFVLEGSVAVVVEALRNAAGGPDGPEPDVDIFICSEPVMEKLSELGSGSRVIAVFDFIDRELGAGAGLASTGPGSKTVSGEVTSEGPLVYLAGVGDPGNAGSIIRSAAALGAGGVAFSPDAVDPYSSKCQRAAMGSDFRMPLYIDLTSDELIAWAVHQDLPIVAGDPHGGTPLWEESVAAGGLLAEGFVLVLGSERKGVPVELLSASRLRLRIPQLPGAESLNVAMAGTVILYEALRQRQGDSC